MAQIPTGNFGNSVAGEGPMVQVPHGNPLGQAADQAIGLAQHISAQAAEEDRSRMVVQQRARAALALAQVTNDLHDAHDEIGRGLLDGSIAPDKAAGTFEDRMGKIRQARLQGLPDEERSLIEGPLTNTAGTLGRSLSGLVVKRQQSDTAADLDQLGENLQRDAMRRGPEAAARSYDSVMDFAGGGAGLTPAQVAAKKQAFREGVTRSFYEQAGVAALTKGDAEGLGGLIEQVKGDQGEAMDPLRRAQLTHQLFGWQQSILAERVRSQNRASDEERKRFNDAVDGYNQAIDLATSGAYFSPDFIKDITTRAAGTQMEQPVAALIGSQAKVAGFASMPAAQRAAELEVLRSRRATPGVGSDPIESKQLDIMEKMDEKLRAAAKENPWAAAEKSGVIQSVQQINLADPAQAQQLMAQRMRDIGDVETWAGHKVSPLQPVEVEQVQKMVRTLPVDQAATMLGQFGATIGDSERVAQVAKQLSDKDGTLGMAMMFATTQTTQGRYTAELVLRGEQAIKDDRIKVDGTKETGWRADIAKQVRGAYSNTDLENKVIDAAFLIMAARASDPSQASTTTEKAVQLASGGGIVERNGQRIPLPYAMKEADFDKAIAAIKPEDLAAQAPGGQVFVGRTAMPLQTLVSQLPQVQLVHAGQGLYNIRAGSLLVTNAQGQRITLKVGP
jgi:hypothetical protein